MDDNKQQQADEIAVLESIYPENITVAGDCLQVDVHLEFDAPLNVFVKNEHGEIPQALHSLPPIQLGVVFHEFYPSNEPPTYTLSCSWLSRSNLSALCRKLDELWEDSKGEVIIYRWIDWMHTEGFAHLKITSPYALPLNETLTPEQELESDARALSMCDQNTFRYMLDFDRHERKRKFEQNPHECGICCCEHPGYAFVYQDSCEHTFCADCMRQFCVVNIASGSVDQLKCPDRECRQQVLPHVIRQLVSPEEFVKYERLLLEKSLSSMADVTYCPQCNAPVITDTKLLLGPCTSCFFSFCTNCLSAWHPGQQCLSDDSKLVNLERRQANASEIERKKLQAEFESLKWMRQNSQSCPKCKQPIEKIDGCNKMTCFKCGTYFCWLCNKVIPGYEHFQNGRCALFPGDDPRAYREVHLNPADMFQIRLEANRNPVNLKRCIRCGQQNLRENNNNHIVCWNCRVQFCFLCSSQIFGTNHFGTKNVKGCKQHTADE